MWSLCGGEPEVQRGLGDVRGFGEGCLDVSATWVEVGVGGLDQKGASGFG